MKLVHRPTDHSSLQEVGGKGQQLQKLHGWQAKVSPFIILSTAAFDFWQNHQKIHPDIIKSMNEFLNVHPSIALRSSMIGEDQLDASFAGLFETHLDVTLRNWQEKLISIYESVSSPRVKTYIHQKQLSVQLQMAVVAQKLIHSTKSGVLFTRAPVQPSSVIAIDAASGMGEGVVSGTVDVDHYQITRLGDVMAQPAQGVLNETEIRTLVSEALRLEEAFGQPADIEWGWDQEQLYIFQIRPITQNFSPLKVFADTNLSESYPGTVSPFTAMFVQRAYENVFTESAVILGARGKRLETLKRHYAHIIAHVDDHLYYDLEHYYAVLRALPGGEKNIDNWHKMIGGKIQSIKIPYHATTLSKLETVEGLFRLIEYAFKKKRRYADFLLDLDQLALDIHKDMKELKTSHDLIAYIEQLMSRPLGFGLTVANDVFIMIGLGLLSSRLKNQGFSEDVVIDLLKTHGSLDSVKPLESFEALTRELSSEFLVAFDKLALNEGFNPYGEAFQKLTQQGFEREVKLLSIFLQTYGDRSFEELKLESLDRKSVV